jgi:transcriptional regulator with XRE-family HTH domain
LVNKYYIRTPIEQMGEQLREIRDKGQRLTIKDVVARTGMSNTTIGRIEKVKDIYLSSFFEYAKAIGIKHINIEFEIDLPLLNRLNETINDPL